MPEMIRYHFHLFKSSGGVVGKGNLAALLPYREEHDNELIS